MFTSRGAAALSALISIGAGLYMLLTQAADSNSLFNPLLHGIGAYFVARGIWMGVSLNRQVDQAESLKTLVEFRAYEYAREHPPEAPDAIAGAPAPTA